MKHQRQRQHSQGQHHFSSIPDYAMDNICDLRPEMQGRCMSAGELSDISGVSVTQIRKYAGLYAWPSQESYNKLARVLGWRL